jgi:hypothetical protein
MSNKKDILIQKVGAAQRKLSGRWTMSSSIQDMSPELEEELGKILLEEIEAEQLIENLKNIGWYSIEKSEYQTWNIETISKWCSSNCLNKYKVFGYICLFENKEDAVKFNLVWG